MLFKRKPKPPQVENYRNPEFMHNRILSESVHIDINTNPHVLVIGNDDDAANYITANLLQLNSHYVIQDNTGGALYQKVRPFLEEQGYQVQVLNLVDMEHSDTYNPLLYIRTEEDIQAIVRLCTEEGIISPQPSEADDAIMWLLLHYVQTLPEEQRTFATLMETLTRYNFDDEDVLAAVPELFEVTSEEAMKRVHLVKELHVNRLKSALVIASIRLCIFNLPATKALTSANSIDIHGLDTGKKALFMVMPEADTTFNSLAEMLMMHICHTLLHKQCENRIMLMVRHTVPGLLPLLMCKNKNLDITLLTPNVSHIKKSNADWELLLNAIPNIAFYGGLEYASLEYVSRRMGDLTIVRNKSKARMPENMKNVRYCMTPEDIWGRNSEDCCVIVGKCMPLKDKKYILENHPNYPLLHV